MKNTVKELDICKRLLTVEVSAEEVANAYKEVYSQIQKTAKIPGFRQGKVPMDMVKKRYADMAREEVLRELIPESYSKAVREEGLKPIGLPEVQNVKMDEGSGLTFEAKFDIGPTVKLKNYKGLKIKKQKEVITDQEVNKALIDMQNAHATYKTIEDRKIVQAGDFIVCNAEWFTEGKSVQTKKDLWLPIEKEQLPEGLFDAIVGKNVGEKAKASIAIPEDFQKKEFASKSCDLEVEITGIKQKELPKLDDEFAKDLGQFKGLDEFKAHMKSHLLDAKKKQIRKQLEDQIVEQLIKANSFHLPASLVESEEKALFEDTKQRMEKQGMKPEDIEKQRPEMEKHLHAHAEKEVKSFFILQEIAIKENASITDKEIDDYIEVVAKQMNQEAAKIKAEWEKKNLIDRLRWQLTEAKIMDMLIKEAKVTET